MPLSYAPLLLDFQISSDGMSRLNEYTRNRADILHALTRPQVTHIHAHIHSPSPRITQQSTP